jgi:hypothetical protein
LKLVVVVLVRVFVLWRISICSLVRKSTITPYQRLEEEESIDGTKLTRSGLTLAGPFCFCCFLGGIFGDDVRVSKRKGCSSQGSESGAVSTGLQ